MKSALRLTANAVIIILLSVAAIFADEHAKKSKHEGVNVLKVLLDGNQRFVDGTATHPHQDRKTILETSKGQNPIAVIIACSDSRVPVETLFDAGVGDIFVIRTAGNIIGNYEMGSIQYAVEHLGVKFVGVLGHTDCGAIKAFAHGHEGEGNIKDIIKHIRDEEEEQEIPEPKHEHMERCIYANIFHGMKQIKNDPMIQRISKEHGEVQVLPMIYNVETGSVNVLDPDMKAPH
ncbi:MAG: carbonic anhydrase [Candidatus Kapabacteria bacterium]|nr:carbonic anhydrase [Ignavibacteriota bacterium]MCW5885176.1 carbonic anhydrase [Candidatus Kapabacteria bacterium]